MSSTPRLYRETRGGLAVAPHAGAAESAATVLADGGNAAEACVSMAATLAAVYPRMGHAGAIVRHPDGLVEGASDPRSDGAAVAADGGCPG